MMDNYNAEKIQSLEGIDHVRLRPSMYIGDIGKRGLHHLVYEVIDNSIDETMGGFCDKIWGTIHKDNSITIRDNGRGIPVDYHKKEGKSALEVVMTKIGAGGKFDKSSYKVSGGLHGIGISCVNALSSSLKTKVFLKGKIFYQEYVRGRAFYPVQIIGETNLQGTDINFHFDKNIFNHSQYDYDCLVTKFRELSFLNKGLTIFLSDERSYGYIDYNSKRIVFYSEDGIKGFMLFIEEKRETLIPDIIYMEGERENIHVEVAMRYNTSFNEKIHSYVNNIKTQEGGTHISGFHRALTRTLKKYVDESVLLAKEKIYITGDDFKEGLTAIISIKVMDPQFEGQTKTKLSNAEVSGIVDSIVGEVLSDYLEEHPSNTNIIIDKILITAKARQAAKKARELIQKKNIISVSSLPGKLTDCSSNEPSLCEIYLVEGDSAAGTAKQGRDREFQAILPLRGKILNVEKAMQYKIFENEEIRNLYTALGVSIGTPKDKKELNIEKLRYHKIIIMTDADIDGSHISTLILTLFFRYMKILIEKGYIFIATPPVFLVKKGNKSAYAWNNIQREKIINKLGGSKGLNIQRYKGLGEMNAEQLWETTMNPRKRILRRITIENATEADHIFSMLMGDDVTPRRQFIENNAIYARIDA